MIPILARPALSRQRFQELRKHVIPRDARWIPSASPGAGTALPAGHCLSSDHVLIEPIRADKHCQQLVVAVVVFAIVAAVIVVVAAAVVVAVLVGRRYGYE